MAAIGYIAGTSADINELDHTANENCWFAHGLWWALFQDTSVNDWFLWKRDGAIPGTPGTLGGWTKITGQNLKTQDSAKPDVYYNATDDLVHIYWMHSTRIYQELEWNGTSSEYEKDTTLGDVTVTGGPTDKASLVVDSTGQAWIVYIDDAGNALKAFYSTNAARSTWAGTPVTIESGMDAAGGDLRCQVVQWTNGGVASIGAGYHQTGTTRRWVYRADSAGDTATWTAENIDTVFGLDDHLSIRSIELGSDTTSTILLATKDSGNDIKVFKRSSGGTWSDEGVLNASATRPHVCVDAENEEVYIFYNSAGSSAREILYRKSAIGTISWGTETAAIDSDDTTTIAGHIWDNCKVARQNVDATSNLLVMAFTRTPATDEVWYNELTIASSGGGGIELFRRRREMVQAA